MTPDALAIYGGTRAVPVAYRDRWRQIRFADAWRILGYLWRDVNAAAKGDDGTNDLLVSNVIRTNEMQVWFVAEHLVEQ